MRANFITLLPREVPPLDVMLEDLGHPSPSAIALALDVHVSTVERWRRLGRAPRPAMLALFSATSWGRSTVNCQAENDAKFYFGYATALRAELDAANAKLARLGQIGEFGSANDPAQGVPATLKETPQAPAVKAQKRPDCPRRAELAEKRLAKRASGPPKPFDFLRTG